MTMEIMETNTLKVKREAKGNYFIMDSEQLVSNPYQELQVEALDSVKKVSNTEKLTGVRNNVCEHNLRTATQHIEHDHVRKLRDIHISSNNLRYEVKLMDINRRKNGLELQKRELPKKDFSYDSRQIHNTEKRLGVVTDDAYYLARKQAYPLRGHELKDYDAKPIIKKARRAMVQHSNQKKHENQIMLDDRATTALTMSTAINIDSKPPSPAGKMLDRRGSKSAPPLSKQYEESTISKSQTDPVDAEDKLPSLPGGFSTASRNTKSHVKFSVMESVPTRQAMSEALYRSKTYHSGMTRRNSFRTSNSGGWDSDSDDDYNPTEKVDLRALFFGNKTEGRKSFSGVLIPGLTNEQLSSDTTLMHRIQSAKPPREEEVELENKKLREKIDAFIGTIHKKDQLPEVKPKEVEPPKPKPVKSWSKAKVMLNIFAKPIDKSLVWGGAKEQVKEVVVEKVEPVAPVVVAEPTPEEEEKQRIRNRWELIRVGVKSGSFQRKYTANDLLLQQLTGILVHSDDKKMTIPIRSAGRALRHTPTFKMRRVVEELHRQRTRFEQQEVEELQRKQMYGEHGMYGDGGAMEDGIPPRAWATPTKELEQES